MAKPPQSRSPLTLGSWVLSGALHETQMGVLDSYLRVVEFLSRRGALSSTPSTPAGAKSQGPDGSRQTNRYPIPSAS